MLKVSVNVPAYNRAHLIRHALDSVLRQTYSNLEIVVVDDGSNDGTAAVVAEYGDRVRYVYQPNGGLGVARNTALDRSTGDYIAFLDSDDEWLDFKIGLQVAALERLPAGFLFSEFVILKDDGRRIHEGSRTWLTRRLEWADVYAHQGSSNDLGFDPALSPRPFVAYWGEMYRSLLEDAFVLPTTAIVRRDAIGSVRFTERTRIFEDWEFFARLARSHQGAFLDIETAVNRGHESPDRLTRSGPLTKAERYVRMVERVWLADQDFRSSYAGDLGRAASNGLLMLAREALLASKPEVARRAIERWAALPNPDGRTEATVYSWLASVPRSRHLLKGALVGRSVVQSVFARQ